MIEKYKIAEEQAIDYIFKNYPKTIAIIVSGSIVREEYDKNSDLDIYVIHTDPYRQRITKIFNDVPCDLFINTLKHTYKYFKLEHKKNRPVTADIISTGRVVYGEKHQEIVNLISNAQKEALSPLSLTKEERKIKEAELLTIFEDITDVFDNDLIHANYLVHILISKIIDYAFIYTGNPLPRAKNRLKVLEAHHQMLGSLIITFFKTEEVPRKIGLCKTMIETLVDGYNQNGIEWASEREY